LLPQCDKTLYIEATLPRVTDQNLELWLLRVYFPSSNLFVTFGILLIPRELLHSVSREENTFDEVVRIVF
jgi:hypothetical protein